MENIRLLFIDEDKDLIDSITEHFSGTYTVFTAHTSFEAMEILDRQGPFAVIVCNLYMSGVSGIDFLRKVRKAYPNTRRIILSEVSDSATIILAINRARVYHYVTKPCPPVILEMIIEKAVKRYRYIATEKNFIDETIKETVNAFSDILAMTNPVAFTRCSRIASVVLQVCKELGLRECWKYEAAAKLSQIGCVQIPAETIEKMYQNEELSFGERKMLKDYPQLSHNLISDIPKMNDVAKMVLNQREDFTGPPMPPPPPETPIEDAMAAAEAEADEAIQQTSSDEITVENSDEESQLTEQKAEKPVYDPYAPENLEYLGNPKDRDMELIGAELLRVAIDLETKISCGYSLKDAIAFFKETRNIYNPHILVALSKVELSEPDKKIMDVPVTELNKYMYFEENVCSKSGALLATKGQKLTPALKELFDNYYEQENIQETVKVSIPNYS